MGLPDCYRIMNVVPGVDWEEIKKNYHALAKQYHPDLHPGNKVCEARFKEINRAFQILESHYRDQFESDPDAGALEVVHRDEHETPEEMHDPEESHPVERQWFQKFQEGLWEFERKLFLLDVKRDVTIDPGMAVTGGTLRVRKGSENFQVRIPAGTWNKISLRIPEKGESSLFMGKRGDLLLNIEVLHPDQMVDGDTNYYYDFPVSRQSLENGRVFTLDTCQGPIKFVLPKKTVDGQTFVLKAKPDSEAHQKTNHIVRIHLV